MDAPGSVVKAVFNYHVLNPASLMPSPRFGRSPYVLHPQALSWPRGSSTSRRIFITRLLLRIMSSTVTIRAARLTDLHEIWRVHSTAIHTTCRGHYDDHVLHAWTERLTPESYRDLLARATMVVAEESDGVVGFGQLDPSTGEVQAVYVAPEAQGRGIGAALLGHLEHSATLEGRTQLSLKATLNAVPFYAACGWHAEGTDVHKITEEISLVCVAMRKDLGCARAEG